MIQRPRIPAIATLSIVLVAGFFFLGWARRGNSADAAELAELQAEVAKPDAKPEMWLRYADKLQRVGQLTRAAAAYQQVLEKNPYHREARLNCATVLAQAGQSDTFLAFLKATLAVDPKLTLNILGRPEVGRYLNDPEFQTLQKNAVAQSMD
jgi:Flp pilus assembly protein TadD